MEYFSFVIYLYDPMDRSLEELADLMVTDINADAPLGTRMDDMFVSVYREAESFRSAVQVTMSELRALGLEIVRVEDENDDEIDLSNY